MNRLRHRRRRWVALVGAFALLFNQIALAQHLCLYAGAGQPQATVVVDAHGDPGADCHGHGVAQSPLTDTDGAACAVHCSDGDKQSRDLTSLKVPDLIATCSEVAQLRSTRDESRVVAIAELPRQAHPRRTTDFGVLLI